MTTRLINPSIVDRRDINFDWRTFIASSIFFFMALINLRDFPVNNIPSIYPAFVLFVLILGPGQILQGFLKTKFLSFLIIAYWFYYRILILTTVGHFALVYVAYLVEPIMMLVVAGMVTIRPGGAKAALWALVSGIVFSTVCGIWIYFIGEPLSTFRSTIHTTIGGNILSSEFIREVDQRLDVTTVVLRNTGLSYFIFSFSYQLAVAASIISSYLWLTKRIFNLRFVFLWGCIVILFVGIVTNGERASIISVSFGLLSLLLVKWEKISKFRLVIICIIGFVLNIAMTNYFSSKEEEHYTLYQRRTRNEGVFVRSVVVPIAAIKTVFSQPLGAGGLSDNYKNAAIKAGWLTKYGKPKSGHNHFANVIMYTGIVGIIITIIFFRGLWKKIKYVRILKYTEVETILVIACITSVVHSFTHNTGFFTLEPVTIIVFGLLWASTSQIKYPHSSKPFKRRIT